ncbi:replication-associated recombination protein A [Porphyromonas sp.]|uniref:replication-associated recombination protein A n=1 Tax=Porphyromonas sp. TaxID=1924944 RepID=UPI0026DA874F|nr:replication-associated recombination protein A [Porphyromonas sp.]MDO4695508.1 replication-associated recombination protein A [Porphyromonas sp.]MDO4770251.1 replication-associated recombination protein A [Porphyromonas sp.]
MTALAPLAERMRPQTLDSYVGQEHLVAPGAPLYEMLSGSILRSFILWGPPGVGKTTLAHIISKTLGLPFYTLSAVSSGVKDVRDVIRVAEDSKGGLFSGGTPILFIDEIHRFNKSQQDSLLHAVERGVVTLVGATTENPSFEIIRPLLSRCRVFVLKSLDAKAMRQLLDKTIETDTLMQAFDFEIVETDALFAAAAGDARKLLNIIELLTLTPEAQKTKKVVISNENVAKHLQQNPAVYDKGGEMHYDIISAFIKSVRGSHPDAALYWLARMIEGGEDPKFIARRLVILASEDIGLANPNALLIAQAAFDAIEKIGWPEGRISLSEATIYLATSPKSNSAYEAIDKALAYVRANPAAPVPMHLRNAPTELMSELGYGAGYIYPHLYKGNYAPQQYLPEEVKGITFWEPADNIQETRLMEFVNSRRQMYGEKTDILSPRSQQMHRESDPNIEN